MLRNRRKRVAGAERVEAFPAPEDHAESAAAANARRLLMFCRTFVLKNKQGKWGVDPQPERTSLLSAGLDEASASTQDFSEVYAVK